MENDDILNGNQVVCDTFNQYYIDAAADIGPVSNIDVTDPYYVENIILGYASHPSVINIVDTMNSGSHTNKVFTFSTVNVDTVCKHLCNINTKKATGYDMIPPKLVKIGSKVLCYPIHNLINMCIMASTFPSRLKNAEVTPIYKKGDNMLKSNYRPVSVLTCISKIFERVLLDQMNNHMEPMFSPEMSGFRKGHNCEHVLMKFTSDVYQSLDNGESTGAVLTDLSKAFDSLPHSLLVAKLHAYGFDISSCKLVGDYLSNRLQRVKLGSTRSEWLEVQKGAPQGSLMGPFAYNVHSNDILSLMSRYCTIHNYADDNTIAACGQTPADVISKLEFSTEIMIKWFKDNYMRINPDKFQFIMFDKYGSEMHKMRVDDTMLTSQAVVKLLGINIDRHLTFSDHVNTLCKKAGRKLNVLCRMSNMLDVSSRRTLSNSFILSQFEYCSCIWHFTNVSEMKQIEKLQKRTLRHVYNDFSSTYGELLQMNNTCLMYVKRLKKIALEVYNIVNKNSPIYLHDMFLLRENTYNLRNNFKSVSIPKFSCVKYGKRTFKYEGAKLWNSLKDKNMSSTRDFKKYLSDYFIPNCTCTNCILCSVKNV